MTTALSHDPGPFFALSKAPLAVLRTDGTIVRANAAFGATFADSKVEGVSLKSLLREADGNRAEKLLLELAPEAALGFDGTPLHTRPEQPISLRFQATRLADDTILLTAVPHSELGSSDALKLTCFDRIVNSGPVGYWVTDAQGVYTFNDGKAGEKLGIKPGGMVGMDSREMWKGSEAYESILASLRGEEVHVQTSVPGIDVEVWYLPIRDAQGTLTGTVGFCIDVTAQKNAERTLRDQLAIVEKQNATLQMFGRVLESAPLILWATDENGKVTMVEGKGTELIGMKPGQTVGENAIELYKDSPEIAGAIVRTLAGDELRTVTRPAPDVYFDAWFMPLRARDTVQGAIGLCIDASERMKNERDLRDKLELIERQSATIRALATPIIRIWDEVLCLPVIGTVDSARTADMMQALLEAIVRDQARFAIIDLTGVEVVDTSTADHLIQLFRAAKVLGVDGVLCGIRPAVAQTVVALGLELGSVKTMRTLRDALKWCIRARGQGQQALNVGQFSGHGMAPANSNGQPAFSRRRASGDE